MNFGRHHTNIYNYRLLQGYGLVCFIKRDLEWNRFLSEFDSPEKKVTIHAKLWHDHQGKLNEEICLDEEGYNQWNCFRSQLSGKSLIVQRAIMNNAVAVKNDYIDFSVARFLQVHNLHYFAFTIIYAQFS